MNPPPIRTIYDLADYFGFRVELLDLPANNPGFLDPNDEYIAVNRHLPHCEQVFTVAHELCHFISDHKRPRRNYPSRWLNQSYQSRPAKFYVRSVRFVLNRLLPPEREADMFAMSWLVQYGGGRTLKEFLDRHPEKFSLCLFVSLDALIRLPFRLAKTILVKLFLTPNKL
jgi:hypothetical protein